MCWRKSRNYLILLGLQEERWIWTVADSFSVSPDPTHAQSGTGSHSSHLLLPAWHRCATGCQEVSSSVLFLLFSSRGGWYVEVKCHHLQQLPLPFLCLEVFILSPLLVVLHPSLATCLSIVSLPSAVPLVPGTSPVIPWLTLSSLYPPYLLFLLTGWGSFLAGSLVSSQANLFPWAPLCSFVHGAKCHIRNSNFAHTAFPFLSLSPSSLLLLSPVSFIFCVHLSSVVASIWLQISASLSKPADRVELKAHITAKWKRKHLLFCRRQTWYRMMKK